MAIISCFPQSGGGEALRFQNVIVNASDWVASSYNAAYPYEATVSLNGITADYFPVVVFSQADEELYGFADFAKTGTDSVTIYAQNAPSSIIIIPAIDCYETIDGGGGIGTLEDTDWAIISTIAQMGIAADVWSVGDDKSITLNGTIGAFDYNITLCVYIIGINHEGRNGITFQGFKIPEGNKVAIISNSGYGSRTSDGTLTFNFNHWATGSNYGGWKGSDLRYDILGSTDVAPSEYGEAPTRNRAGYDASSTTATSPVSNTLMSALPSALRTVMRPITVYTDNGGATSHNTESYVTSSVDYLPLLAEYEVFGTGTNANEYEQNYQTQYDYYASGGSKVLYRHSSPDSSVYWWLRSPYKSNGTYCCVITGTGASNTGYNNYSRGLAPIFLV